MPRPLAILAALALSLAPASASAQSVTADVPAGNVTRFEVAGPARVEYTGRTIVIVLGDGPAPDPSPKPEPAPQPPPPPKPDPTPAPVAAGKIHVTLVFDPSIETAAQAKARREMRDSREWQALGAVYRAYSLNDPTLDAQGFRGRIDATALPMAFIQLQQDGADTAKIVTTMLHVGDKAYVVEAVKEARGGR